jgi:hypothetical protein
MTTIMQLVTAESSREVTAFVILYCCNTARSACVSRRLLHYWQLITINVSRTSVSKHCSTVCDFSDSAYSIISTSSTSVR